MTEAVSNPHVYLPGLALAGYRSFGPDIQCMGPFSQINVFAGPNNVGKSNILRFVHRHLTDYSPRENPAVNNSMDPTIDKSYYGDLPVVVGIPMPTDFETVCAIYSDASRQQLHLAYWLLNSKAVAYETHKAWNFACWKLPENRLIAWVDREPFKSFFLDLVRESESPFRSRTSLEWKTGRNIEHLDDIFAIAQKCFATFQRAIPSRPPTHYIPAFRQISAPTSGPEITYHNYAGDGANLVHVYAAIEQADHTEFNRTQPMVNSIRKFLIDVTGEPDIALKVPYHRKFFEVVRNGRPERLDSLGTGIHQLVLLAIVVTLNQNAIICIEEPELFLHPILQRKFIDYLENNTSNQYFISTHSAQFLDMPGVSLFHLEMTGDGTKATKAETSSARFAVCRDLGYRASDIVQANCIVWVEGPSELIYLRKWIEEIDPKLRHGIEYTVMFYGGSLSSWLTGDAPEETDELISLVTINRHSAFVLDSDKNGPDDSLKHEKVTVKNSIDNAGGFTWVTQGREIENYIPFDQMQSCVKQLRRATAEPLSDNGLYGFAYPRNADNKSIIPKTKLANAICDIPVQWGDTDLKDRVWELANYIRQANRLPQLALPT